MATAPSRRTARRPAHPAAHRPGRDRRRRHARRPPTATSTGTTSTCRGRSTCSPRPARPTSRPRTAASRPSATGCPRPPTACSPAPPRRRTPPTRSAPASRPPTGEKLVGVLIDYGTTADAAGGQTPPKPRAACAVVPTAANGQQVLDAVSDLRLDESARPAASTATRLKACSVTVKNPPAAAKEQPVSLRDARRAKSETSASSKPASRLRRRRRRPVDAGRRGRGRRRARWRRRSSLARRNKRA